MSSDRVDDILRKITASGIASLSEGERAALNEASSKARVARTTAVALIEDDAEDQQVSREVAAKAHCAVLARGISSVEVVEIWEAAGYVFKSGRQPLLSELKLFQELAARVTCARCGRESDRFFVPRYGKGSVCADCRDS